MLEEYDSILDEWDYVPIDERETITLLYLYSIKLLKQ